jgi:hypothetical protein
LIAETDFPPELDVRFYRKRHADLRHLTDEGLVEHFDLHGRREGRYGSAAIPRQNFIKLFPVDESVLEIGPFARPTAVGSNVKYFDVLDQSALKARARVIGLNDSHVPHINFISPTGDLSIINETFRCVVSSHSIEHQPDLVRHLHQVEGLLIDEGVYFIVVPDKRFCFDHFLPESSIADVIDAYYAARSTHSLSSVVEHRALTTHNEPLRHWQW